MAAATPLDEVKILGNLVCAIYAKVDIPRTGIFEQRDVEFQSLPSALFARGNAHESLSAVQSVGHALDK